MASLGLRACVLYSVFLFFCGGVVPGDALVLELLRSPHVMCALVDVRPVSCRDVCISLRRSSTLTPSSSCGKCIPHRARDAVKHFSLSFADLLLKTNYVQSVSAGHRHIRTRRRSRRCNLRLLSRFAHQVFDVQLQLLGLLCSLSRFLTTSQNLHRVQQLFP